MIVHIFRTLADAPTGINKETKILNALWIDTVLGPMIAIADDKAIYLLEFITRRGLKREIEGLRKRGFTIIPDESEPLTSLKLELTSYFEGKLTVFNTPYRVFGTPFQQQVWQALCKIPYGETLSYAEQAASIGSPSAYRAVGNANGTNQLAIIIPCHRIIASDGSLGGYGGGLATKQWLLNHEKLHK